MTRGARASPPIGQLEDGSLLFAPLGELLVDVDEDRVCCHACGGWYRVLGPHLRHRHEFDPATYRRCYGLQAQRGLVAPGVARHQAERMRQMIATDPRVQNGMQIGAERARTGELPRQGTAAAAREQRLERSTRRKEQGRGLGTRRAQSARNQREARARQFGYASLAGYLRKRYLRDGLRVTDIATELGAYPTTIVADMDHRRILRRPRGERTRRAHVARRAASPR